MNNRFSLFALVAIVIPAAIVAVLGWVSLRQWEKSADLLFQKQAREVASMAAEKVTMVLRQAEDQFLSRLQSLIAREDFAEPAVTALVDETPLIQRLYLVDRGGALLYPNTRPDEDARVYSQLAGTNSSDGWEPGGRRDVLVGDRVVGVAFLKSPDGSPVLAAFVRSDEVLRREILEKTLAALEGQTVVAVIDHRGNLVYSRAPINGTHPLVTVTFREGLPHWRVALYQPSGFSPHDSVRRQVRIFTAAFGALLVVIVFGIVATWRLMRREIEVARLKSDFVANVSHDLKTPLSVIRMFSETLEMGRVVDEATRHEYYRVMTRESERLSRLIDNVLDFSRIEGGRRRYVMVPTAVEPLVRTTIEAFDYPLTQRGFKVAIAVAPNLPEITMDGDAIGQALANLVDNAVKYSGERQALSIEAAIIGGELALAVADEGIGIPREEQARIFEKFYRVGRSETQGRRGSGVGLALVRHITEAHGGRVTVESTPGEGSRFTMWLPAP